MNNKKIKGEAMTAPHVIEKLKNDGDWVIVAKNDHELALIINALLDFDHCSKKFARRVSYGFCAIKKRQQDNFLDRADCLDYLDLCDPEINTTDISEWFFREVNNC